MDLAAICKTLQYSDIGTSIRESTWTFPIVETTHVIGLSISVGLILITDLRLIGAILRKRAFSEVWAQLKPWFTVGFIIMFISGILLFWSQALKAYQSIYFRAKIVFLILAGINALVFEYTSRPTVCAVGHSGRSSGSSQTCGMDLDRPLGRYHCRGTDDGLYLSRRLSHDARNLSLLPVGRRQLGGHHGAELAHLVSAAGAVSLVCSYDIARDNGRPESAPLGVVLRKQPLPELARELSPWTAGAITVVLASGIPMFFSGALRYYDNTSFRIKMVALFCALVFHFAYFRRVVRRDESTLSRLSVKLAGIGALVLWFGVGLAGRGIGFVG